MARVRPGTNGNQISVNNQVHTLTAPGFVAFDATTRADDGTAVPEVVYATAGETISITYSGTTCSYTAPSPFTTTATSTCGGSAVHVLPKVAPTSAAQAAGQAGSLYTSVSTLEDQAVNFQLVTDTTYAGGIQPVIATLPTSGTLYQIPNRASTSTATPITTAGTAVTGFGRYVRYVSNPNLFGSPADTIGVSFKLVGTSIVSSTVTNVPINIVEQDDLPQVNSYLANFVEDTIPNGYRVRLNLSDAETGQILDGYISRLPTKGRLYAVDTATGNLTQITENYNPFDVGSGVVEQYVSRVDAVSSFWGGPPYAGYHPLQLIGPPDCDNRGECQGNMPWVNDQTIYPDIGTRVVHNGLTASVTNYSTITSTVGLAYYKMYKADGTNPSRQCHIDPAGATRAYPADCLFTNVPTPGATITGEVARSAIAAVPAGVWSPLNINYQANTVQGPQGGAYGPQYRWGPYNHDTTYLPTSGIPYTEFVEIGVAEPVYIFRVQIGQPRGMGAITHILIKDPNGVWVRLYEGLPLLSVFNEYYSQGRYWNWSPEICRSHFKTSSIRIHMDTQGIPEWNYIDYVQVFGSRTLAPAALRTSNTTEVVYVPNANAEGTDSFDYRASDCPGDLIRQSTTGTITFNIAPVNDLPAFTASPTLDANVGPTTNILDLSTILSDVETPLTLLSIVLTSLPALGALYDGTTLITSVPHTVTNTARTLGFSISSINGTTTTVMNFRAVATTTIGMTITDQNNGVTQQSVTLRITDPQIICPSGYIVDFTTAGATCTACNAGTREVDQTECIPCTEGSTCAAGVSVETLNVTESFWRISPEAEVFYPCPQAGDTSQAWPAACQGGQTAGPLGVGYCRSDTFGPRCNICAEPGSNQTVKSSNHYFNTGTLQCIECAAESGRLASSIALVVTLLVVGGISASILGRLWHLPPKSIRTQVLAMRAAFRPFTHLSLTAKLKQLVAFFQLATCFPSVYNVPMPSQYTAIMDALTGWLDVSTLLNFIYPTQCIGTFLTRLNFRAAGPLVLVLLPVMSTMTTGTVSYLLSKDKDRPWMLKSLFSGLQVSVPLTFALVPSVSRAIFTIWECEDIVVSPSSGEVIRFLRDDSSIICGVSAAHSTASSIGIVYLLIWPLGMPALYFFLCWAVRKDNKAGMPTHFARATKFLWGEYRPEYYWWEPLEMARKVVLAGLLMVVVPSSLEYLRLLIAVLISVTFIITLLVIRPFKSPDNNALAACTQIGAILMYQGALVIKVTADYSTNGAGPTITRLVGFATVFDFTIALFFIYGAIFIIIVGFVIVQIITTTIERVKRRHLEDIDQVKAAITSLTQTRYPCVFCRYQEFAELGKMLSHETLRAKGILTVIDTYADLLDFCRDNPTVFVSHQWLSFFVPDPDNAQYRSICSAINALAARDKLAPTSVYVWLDYLSIPQANPFMQAMAIDSLGVYASACRYFIVAAPPSMHREKQVICDHNTYAGRGWCRLEQWARMQDGLENMYLTTSPGNLEPIADMREWYEQSMLVFEGQFTVDTDKIKMVNIVLGLWAKTAAEIRAGKQLSSISQIIVDRRDEVFPKEYFFKLTDTLNEVLANPTEEIDALITLMSQRGQVAAKKTSGDEMFALIDTDGDGNISEEEIKDAIAKGIFNQGQVSASTRNLLAGVPNMSSAKVMPNPPSGGATETVTELKAEDLDP